MKRDSSASRCNGIYFAMAAWLAGSLAIGSPVVAQAASTSLVRAVPLIEGSIDETQRVTLRGNTRPEALRAEFDRGAVDDSFPLNGMQLQLKRSEEHEAAAEALADELHRKGSPQFHQWLTTAEYAEWFGVATQDIDTIRAWLQAHGFTVHSQSVSRMTIDFSGAAGQVREAFGTQIHALNVVSGISQMCAIRRSRRPSLPWSKGLCLCMTSGRIH